MIRSALVARIHAQNPHLYEREVEGVVRAILDRIADALVADDRVELRGFGAFLVEHQRARLGRNPRTGEAVEVAEKAVIRFKAGRMIRTLLNDGSEAAAQIPRARRAS